MANDNGAGAGAAAAAQPDRQGGGQQPNFLQDVAKMIFWFICFQNLAGLAQKKGWLPSPDMPKPQTPQERFQQGRNDAAAPAGASHQQHDQQQLAMGRPTCLWSPGADMSLHVFLSDRDTFAVPAKYKYSNRPDENPTKLKESLAEWHEAGLSLYDSETKCSANITVPLSRAIRYNETQLYAHVRLVRHLGGKASSSKDDDSKSGGVRKVDVLSKRFNITRYRLRKKLRDEKSLLGGDDEDDNAQVQELDESDDSPLTLAGRDTANDQLLLYTTPSLTLQVVDMGKTPQFPNRQSIPKQFGDHMDWLHETSTAFYPILYSSQFWVTKSMLYPINGSTPEISLEMTLEPVSMWKWQLMSQMEQSWKQQEDFMGDEDASGSDMFRTMLLETNPVLLVVTAIVSILHTVFDMLAFKNDISFFKNKKSMEGISIRSMIVNASFQIVILAYLADNETSMMVLVSNGLGLVIEFWKISKAVTVSYTDGKIQWKETKTYTQSKTKEYDEIAMNHLLYVTFPLVAGYGCYSLIHQQHKGWYSWILNTLVGFIYMFGFVTMTPQLFINYKLKSVAHLNWRTMTYKSINTFIDDLFAFVIKMPIMHRLACLRDDVIFFIFLWQRYIYRTDYSRVNEFGQCAEPTEEMIREMEKEKAESEGDAKVPEADVEERKKAAKSNIIRQRRGARDKR